MVAFGPGPAVGAMAINKADLFLRVFAGLDEDADVVNEGIVVKLVETPIRQHTRYVRPMVGYPNESRLVGPRHVVTQQAIAGYGMCRAAHHDPSDHQPATLI